MPQEWRNKAGLTELTINCNYNIYWYVYITDTVMYLIFKLFYLYAPLNLLCKEMRCLNKIIIIITKKKHQRTQINGFKFSYTLYTKSLENTVALNHSPRLFLLESQSKQQHDFVTGKVKVCNPACLKPSS